MRNPKPDAPPLFDLGTAGLIPPAASDDVSVRTLRDRARRARRVLKMLQKYGAGPDRATCGTCQHFLRRTRYGKNGHFMKCLLFGDSKSESTDWRAGWPACGKYVRVAQVVKPGRAAKESSDVG